MIDTSRKERKWYIYVRSYHVSVSPKVSINQLLYEANSRASPRFFLSRLASFLWNITVCRPSFFHSPIPPLPPLGMTQFASVKTRPPPENAYKWSPRWNLLLRFSALPIKHPMRKKQILSKEILGKIIEFYILGAKAIGSGNSRHARQFVHIYQSPWSRKERLLPAIDPHHARHHTDIVLPSMSELMPPLFFDNLIFIDLFDCP